MKQQHIGPGRENGSRTPEIVIGVASGVAIGYLFGKLPGYEEVILDGVELAVKKQVMKNACHYANNSHSAHCEPGPVRECKRRRS